MEKGQRTGFKEGSKVQLLGIPWWSCCWDCALFLPRAQVWSLVVISMHAAVSSSSISSNKKQLEGLSSLTGNPNYWTTEASGQGLNLQFLPALSGKNSSRRQQVKRKGKRKSKVHVERCSKGLRKGVRAFGNFKYFIRGQFSESLSSFWPIILSLSSQLICLSTITLGVHASLSQDGS